jgi:hypothetical protein
MPRSRSPLLRPDLAERRRKLLRRADRNEQLGVFYTCVGELAAAKGDFKAACQHRELATKLQDVANLIRSEVQEADEELLAARGYRKTSTPARASNGARPRDALGRYITRRNGNGHRRPRERRDGARSSARSGDSGPDGSDPEPAPARCCGCEHPLPLPDSWFPLWVRCLWCGHDAREVVS